MAITNPDDINDLMGLYESDAGITTQNNVGVGGTPNDTNRWDNLKLLAPPQNLIQSLDVEMPEFKLTTTPNLSAAMVFDGVDDFLKTLTGNFFFLDSHTIAMVVKFPPSIPAGPNPVTLAHVTGFGGGGEVLRIVPVTGELEIQNEAGTVVPGVSVPQGGPSGWQFDTWQVVLWTVDATGPLDLFALRIDQTPVGSGFLAFPASPNGLSVGSFEDGTESAEIEVASVVVYKRKLSGVEIIDLENYLNTKYFVVVPPPPPLPPAPAPIFPPRSGVGLKPRLPRFTDLDLDFVANPNTGAVPRKLDGEAVKRAVRNLVQLARYDKPFHPEIDPGVRALLFELVTPSTAVLLQRRITELLNQYEPRVELLVVDVVDRHEQNRYDITVEFRVANRDEDVVVNLSLARLR